MDIKNDDRWTAPKRYKIEREPKESKGRFMLRVANEIQAMVCHICAFQIDEESTEATITYQNRTPHL